MKQKKILNFVIILVLCRFLLLFKDKIIRFLTNKVTIAFLLIIAMIKIIRIILYMQKTDSNHNVLEYDSRIGECKTFQKSSNNEIIKLIGDYSKNKGEKNDNK